MKTVMTALLGLLLSTAALATKPTPPVPEGLAKATFAAGCFWCVEPPFDKLDGVISTTSGYIGGKEKNPSYNEVSRGETGHTEAVEVIYDPKRVSYETLLDTFWINVDPTTNTRQFCDSGAHYRPGIFWHGEEQKAAAEKSHKLIDESGRFDQPIKVEVTEATTFYAAESYHQDYYLRNPARYKYYRWACGRDARLDDLWGELRQ
ncbi:MAG: peptide-methionine (S)-S-oxide reductase MsrA [Gammaproteobacteria bacterium]|nr:peptide-methionine (S)-S-oxide reductase MsrA [Gammaproteobacteria bacterium]